MTAKSFIQKARNNEGFMFGTRRRENEHQKNARISQQIYSVSTPQKVRFKKQSVASSLRNNFSVVPKVSLQKKLDYYFSPYNPKLTFKRYMRFDEEEANNKEDLTESKQKNGEWKFLANFLLNEDLQTFRMACKQINKRFYNKLSTRFCIKNRREIHNNLKLFWKKL